MVDTDELERFWSRPESHAALRRWLTAGLEEDRVDQDLATRALLDDAPGQVVADVTAQAPGVSCGARAAIECFRALDAQLEVEQYVADGTEVLVGAEVLRVRGSAAAILGAERTALNLWSHLSGIATQTRNWSRLCPEVTILDTRKTLPGIRIFQKHAVRCGGGVNHRFDLGEFPMVKENHRKLFRDRHLTPGASARDEIRAIVERVRARTDTRLEVEVEDLESFLSCLEAGVELILLDNQAPTTIAEWIAEARSRGIALAGSALEASGGILDRTLSAYARSGVQRISLGALTHSVRAWDLSLHVRWATEAAK
ncbi:MAG: carboxylating nicotinate-nucleotide diphosphorylase [Planctomycetota bacterium]